MPEGMGHVDPTGRAQRGALVEVVRPSLVAVAGRKRAVRAYDAPPGHRATELRHHPAHAARPANTHRVGEGAIGGHQTRRNLLHQGEHGFDVVLRIHRPMIAGADQPVAYAINLSSLID